VRVHTRGGVQSPLHKNHNVIFTNSAQNWGGRCPCVLSRDSGRMSEVNYRMHGGMGIVLVPNRHPCLERSVTCVPTWGNRLSHFTYISARGRPASVASPLRLPSNTLSPLPSSSSRRLCFPDLSPSICDMGVRRIVGLVACAILPFSALAQDTAASADTTASDAALDASRGAYPLLVDLGYGVYNGVHNSTTQLNVWKGYCCTGFTETSGPTPLTFSQHSLRRLDERRQSVEGPTAARSQ
jgi:hypothetical protein